jgi:hypothetical protein
MFLEEKAQDSGRELSNPQTQKEKGPERHALVLSVTRDEELAIIRGWRELLEFPELAGASSGKAPA